MSREQEFLNAAKTGDQETFIRILNDQSINIDPNLADKDGKTAFIIAVENDQSDIVSTLLADERVDPNQADLYGNTALMWAVYRGHIDVIRALLADVRIDPNHADGDGNTAFILAAENGQSDIVSTLLADARVEPNRTNTYDEAALSRATRNGDIYIVRALLADERIDPNHDNNRGGTALVWAACEGHIDIVRALLADERVNPNLASEDGSTALTLAAENGHSDIVRALIDDPCIDLSHVDQAKKAIKAATVNKHDKTLLLLLKSTGQRLSDDEIANLADSNRDFYKRILTRLLCRARFRGIIRAIIVFRNMRLRAAEAIYAPGGTGYTVAADSFATAARQQSSSSGILTSTETNDTTAGITQTADEQGEPLTKKQRT